MRGLAAALLGLLALVDPVHGCDFCLNFQGNPLALPHPKAIEIAAATRAAIDKGVMKENPLVANELWQGDGQGMTALKKIPPPELVRAWSARIKLKAKEDPAFNMNFLFVDTEQACGVTVRSGTALYEAKPFGHCAARVITTRPAFYAMAL